MVVFVLLLVAQLEREAIIESHRYTATAIRREDDVAEITIRRDGALLQVLIDEQVDMHGDHIFPRMFRFIDMNFDGKADLRLLGSWGAKHAEPIVYFFDDGNFRKWPASKVLADAPDVVVDVRKKQLIARAWGPDWRTTWVYAFRGKELRMIGKCSASRCPYDNTYPAMLDDQY